MTNQQGAPEALEDHQVRKLAAIGAVSTSSGLVERRPIEYRRELENQFVRGFRAAEKRLAALVEAQQPAAHVQNPGEIEHVVGDVSKNGLESNMAQQPAPSAAAVPEGGPPGSGGWQSHAEAMERERDYWRQRAKLMSEHQDGVCWYWQGDGSDYPESLVNSLPVVIRADQLRSLMQPSPTPQADSQPAHQWDTGYPPLPRPDLYDAAAGTVGWSESALQGFVDADRAARAQTADSVTAPAEVAYLDIGAGGYIDLGTDLSNEALSRLPKGRHVLIIAGTYGIDGYTPTQPAQAADSVLEDAARLDWLALAGPTSICVVIDRQHDGEVEVATDDVTGYGKTLREALDAARKQGDA